VNRRILIERCGGHAHKRSPVLDNFLGDREPFSRPSRARCPDLKIHTVRIVGNGKNPSALSGMWIRCFIAAKPDARWGIENRGRYEQETMVTYNVLASHAPPSSLTALSFEFRHGLWRCRHDRHALEKLGPALTGKLYWRRAGCLGRIDSAFAAIGCGQSFSDSEIGGERTTHGVILDFLRQLAKNSAELKVLGTRTSSKHYVLCRDLV